MRDMSDGMSPTKNPGHANHLKDTVEQSLAAMCEPGDLVTIQPKPGVCRTALPLRIDAAYLQRSALAEPCVAVQQVDLLIVPNDPGASSRLLTLFAVVVRESAE